MCTHGIRPGCPDAFLKLGNTCHERGEDKLVWKNGIYIPNTGRKPGKVIKVYHRFNDIEDKWIVSLTGEDIPDEKILGDIAFQEQYFYGKLYDR